MWPHSGPGPGPAREAGPSPVPWSEGGFTDGRIYFIVLVGGLTVWGSGDRNR